PIPAAGRTSDDRPDESNNEEADGDEPLDLSGAELSEDELDDTAAAEAALQGDESADGEPSDDSATAAAAAPESSGGRKSRPLVQPPRRPSSYPTDPGSTGTAPAKKKRWR